MPARILCAALLVALALGCDDPKKPAPAPGPAKEPVPDFELAKTETISDEYLADPAAADAKYQGKLGRAPFHGHVGPGSGPEMVGRFVRTDDKGKKAPNVVFRFASSAEARKIEEGKVYTLEGRCYGIVKDEVMFAGCRVIGEGRPLEK